MTTGKNVPKGRLARLSRMAKLGARSGVSLLAGNDGNAAAEHALEVLGNLRGLAAKVGQMASYVDGVVPASQREAYERVLSGLQAATPSSPFSSVRARIEQELGQELDALFPEFDPTPFASASIGQVHRARLDDGREVAVKVQHPGVEEAFDSDLTGAGSLVGFASILGPRSLDPKLLYDELAERLREELDYTLEAKRQRYFAELHESDSRIKVPAIIDSHSSQRVLTSELVAGSDFKQACQAPEELRARYARTLWQFVFKSMLVHSVFNADPHPGNYRFHPDGSVSFLDFGSVQVLSPAFAELSRIMHASAHREDEAAFRAAAKEACQTQPGLYEDALLSYLWKCFAPLRGGPFHFSREFVADIVQDTQTMKRHLIGKASNITNPPRGIVLLNRVQFGFYSVLAKLDITLDYGALDEELLLQPATHPGGRI